MIIDGAMLGELALVSIGAGVTSVGDGVETGIGAGVCDVGADVPCLYIYIIHHVHIKFDVLP